MDYIGLARVRAIVNDVLYGSIPVNEIEYRIIQTPLFNRLHYIRQLALAYLIYPTAKHTRFEHSLGVMHLSWRILENILTTMDVEELIDIFKPDIYILLSKLHERSRVFNKVYFPSITDLLKAILIQSVRLAGLLHDIGHYPFSHVIEEALGVRGLHEIKTVELILKWKELYDILNKLKIKVGQGRYTGITPEHIALILADNMLRDRMLRGMENYKPLLEPSGYELLHKIISSAFDADRLDYLRRDALSTGMVYGLVDINRIIESTHIVRDGEKYIICYDSKALPALENMMDSRIRMYRLIYYHHKNVILSEIVKRLITRIIDYEESAGRPLVLHEKLKCIFIDKYIDTLLNSPHDLVDELIFTIAKKVLNNKAIKDPVLKYYAKTLFDRRLLPITLFKREEELFDYMKRLCGLRDFNEYKKILHMLASKTNVIEELMIERSNGEVHLITSKASYHGIAPNTIKVKIGNRIEDITDLSHYMKWLEEHYSGYTHIYFYTYTLNEDLMVRYKFDHNLRGEFIKNTIMILSDIIKEIVVHRSM